MREVVKEMREAGVEILRLLPAIRAERASGQDQPRRSDNRLARGVVRRVSHGRFAMVITLQHDDGKATRYGLLARLVTTTDQ